MFFLIGSLGSPITGQNDSLDEAVKASSQAVNLYNQGKYAEAVALAKHALDIRRKLLPPNDPLIRASQTNLAEIYVALQKYENAASLFSEVLKTDERAFPDDPARARVLSRLGALQYALGRPDRTEELYQESIALLERVYGPTDERITGGIFDLAEFYQFVGKLKKAEPLYLRVKNIKERSNSKINPQLPEVLDRYACLLRKSGRRWEAIELEGKSSQTPELDSAISQEQDAAVETNVVNGKALSLPRPIYPAQAKVRNVSGMVTVRVLINELGNVIRACAISGPSELMQETERAAFHARFTPTLLGGNPVKVQGIITYNFVRQ